MGELEDMGPKGRSSLARCDGFRVLEGILSILWAATEGNFLVEMYFDSGLGSASVICDPLADISDVGEAVAGVVSERLIRIIKLVSVIH